MIVLTHPFLAVKIPRFKKLKIVLTMLVVVLCSHTHLYTHTTHTPEHRLKREMTEKKKVVRDSNLISIIRALNISIEEFVRKKKCS